MIIGLSTEGEDKYDISKWVKKGDTIGIIAPSGPFKRYTLKEIEESLEKLGYNVKFGKSCEENIKYIYHYQMK